MLVINSFKLKFIIFEEENYGSFWFQPPSKSFLKIFSFVVFLAKFFSSSFFPTLSSPFFPFFHRPLSFRLFLKDVIPASTLELRLGGRPSYFGRRGESGCHPIWTWLGSRLHGNGWNSFRNRWFVSLCFEIAGFFVENGEILAVDDLINRVTQKKLRILRQFTSLISPKYDDRLRITLLFLKIFSFFIPFILLSPFSGPRFQQDVWVVRPRHSHVFLQK